MPTVLEVDARCKGPAFTAFVASEPSAVAHISNVQTAAGDALEQRGTHFSLPAEASDATLRYRIDLDTLARDAEDMDIALRQDRSLVSPVSSWLLRPDPTYADLPVTVRVATTAGISFTTGLVQRDDGYRIFAHEISVGTYAVFGSYVSKQVSVTGRGNPRGKSAPPSSSLEIVRMDGALAEPDDTVFQWVTDSANEVGKFWQGFPVPRTLVIVLPVPGREDIVFGKVLPESSPAVIVMVGERASRAKLYADWVLVHELFHLGVPSFNREGKWFDEGLATYYEPLVRARAGWISEERVWQEFSIQMRQGLRAMTKTGLESSPDVYWGGALFCLLADVELRKRSEGARGLEDGLRRVLAAGGHPSEVWSLGKTLEIVDSSAGDDLVRSLASRHARRGAPVDLDALLAELGVKHTGAGIELHDGAPFAAIRKALVYGK
jgi:hypothetical protein